MHDHPVERHPQTGRSSSETLCRIGLVLLIAISLAGCSRLEYRLRADQEAYDLIGERNLDARWQTADYSIELDPRSRYFDPYDPDCSPMPPDDPTSHQYMHVVNGTKGWEHWHANGERVELENPAWQEALAEYVRVRGDGTLQLNIDTALNLAYVHSPAHQNQLETLYLSALDVSAERFRLETQFFGGYDARYAHRGSLSSASLFGRQQDRPESNRFTLGRPTLATPAFQARRSTATAGELLAGFANSFVFEFTGGNANLSSSLANFSLVQPLLRGAGRDIALEQLTNVERDLLANLRAYGQYRQGFYTQVAIGELGVDGPQRGGFDTRLTSFSGQAGLSGYLGLLQQFQQIRNSQDNLSLQLRTLARLEAFLDVGVIDLVQVEQFRQSVENERASLLRSRVSYQLALDRYKTNTLGLPPDVPIELDESMIQQFQLVDRQSTALQDLIAALQISSGQLPDNPTMEQIESALDRTKPLIEPIHKQLEETRKDIARMDTLMPAREEAMTAEQREAFQEDRAKLLKSMADRELEFAQAIADLERIRLQLSEATRTESRKELIVWVSRVQRQVERVLLIQARARLEMITVPLIELQSHDAFQIALQNRLDFMNGRAALVDNWRQIQINADALQAVVNITANGDISTARNNPVSFRAPTGNVRLGLEVDAPLTRLLERNAYRTSLIEYQRNRRAFIQSRDSLHLGLRALLREIEQLRANLEIQRRAVTIAIRRVDLTQAALAAPVPPARPGQRAAQFNPTTAINLLSAQTSLRDSQDSLLNVWLNYHAVRMRLVRELGIMVLDEEGRWIEYPIPGSADTFGEEIDPGVEEVPVPPSVPSAWIEFANYREAWQNDSVAVPVRQVGYDSPALFLPVPTEAIRRLPSLGL